MPTRTEAAEALYSAVDTVLTAARTAADGVSFAVPHQAIFDLRNAFDEYRTARRTPDPLPAEVRRVLEAAGNLAPVLVEALQDAYTDSDYDARRFCAADVEAIEAAAPGFLAAVDAYRSASPAPEPLSTRLARLKPGDEVAVDADIGVRGKRLPVIANNPRGENLWLDDGSLGGALFAYAEVRRILSESPRCFCSTARRR